jgi:hypothetical protein
MDRVGSCFWSCKGQFSDETQSVDYNSTYPGLFGGPSKLPHLTQSQASPYLLLVFWAAFRCLEKVSNLSSTRGLEISLKTETSLLCSKIYMHDIWRSSSRGCWRSIKACQRSLLNWTATVCQRRLPSRASDLLVERDQDPPWRSKLGNISFPNLHSSVQL